MYPEVDMIIIKGGIQEVQVGLPRKCLNKSQKSHVQTYSFFTDRPSATKDIVCDYFN